MKEQIKISKISENEYLVGNNITSLMNPNTILVEAVGDQTDELALALKKVCEQLAAPVTGKINYLIDLNRCGKNSKKARATWIEMNSQERTSFVALYGLHPVAKVLATFIMGASGKKNFRFFNRREEALVWLTQMNGTINND
ncbi:hypothetical protein GM418_17000 [Maribellus comscasis]|uniref:DUF7793 domain-containing protein n=1 Tax=Maribellus comscasis TaxID=2681766 RepID=A0A6I6JVI4_9BACT|nr:hypothetical protein [Maribellus comscasis]QGY45309.1 hypothetical protein GM418_17000 [Maribellus comscasis]